MNKKTLLFEQGIRVIFLCFMNNHTEVIKAYRLRFLR